MASPFQSSFKKFSGFSKEQDYAGYVNFLFHAHPSATYDNVVAGFREHLGKAEAGDFAYFHNSGHGSQQPHAEFFHQAFPSRLDEALVLYDSRG